LRADAGGGDFSRVAPTPEHFLPLLYIAGFSAATGDTPKVLVDGYAYGSLSMTSFGVGAPCPPAAVGLPGASPLGSKAPSDGTNI
jgi:4,5-DOPA dioxygenase extradiol